MKATSLTSDPANFCQRNTPYIAGQLPLASICAIFLAADTVPPLLFYLHIGSSLTPGFMIAAAIAIVLVSINFGIVSARSGGPSLLDMRANSVVFIGVTLALICIHGMIASQLVPIDFHRFALSLIPLVFLLASAASIAYVLRSATPGQIDAMAWVCFWAFIGFLLLRVLHLEPNASAYHKPLFPFSEPSHFALAFGPIFLYRSITAPKRWQLAWIAFCVITAVIVRNATLIAFAFGAAMLCRRLLLVTSVATIAILSTAATHLSYFTSRADISSHSRNLSVLVYVQGWGFLWHSLVLTHGWGLGFQQLGISPLHLAVTQLIQRYTNGTALNTKGGGFLFSKLGSEFGIFGVIIAITFIILCIGSIRRLRTTSSPQQDTLARCLIVAFGIDMFVRGSGYFYGQSILFVGAILSVYRGSQAGHRCAPTSRDEALTGC